MIGRVDYIEGVIRVAHRLREVAQEVHSGRIGRRVEKVGGVEMRFVSFRFSEVVHSDVVTLEWPKLVESQSEHDVVRDGVRRGGASVEIFVEISVREG